MRISPVGRAITIRPSFPLPPHICRKISQRAAHYARRLAPRSAFPRQPHHGASLIRPTYRNGEIGIHLPPGAVHLMYQNYGIRPFTMWALEGKTIPIRGPDGAINYRKATGVGKRRITVRDPLGRIVWSKTSWRHPGLRPLYFIEEALRLAVEEWRRSLTQRDIQSLFREVMAVRHSQDAGKWWRRPPRGGWPEVYYN